MYRNFNNALLALISMCAFQLVLIAVPDTVGRIASFATIALVFLAGLNYGRRSE